MAGVLEVVMQDMLRAITAEFSSARTASFGWHIIFYWPLICVIAVVIFRLVSIEEFRN